MDCIFCQIIAGRIPSDIIFQDESVVCFRDIHPLAPTHILVVPKKHIDSLVAMTEADLPLIGALVKAANLMAKKEKIAERGYRLVINCGKEGTQAVTHLHMHLLGGRQLSASLG